MRSYTGADFAHTLRQRAEAMPVKIHEAVKTIWRASCARCVEEMARGVHVDTGMSLASLKPLASLINSRLVPVTATIESLLSASGGPKPGHQHARDRFENNNAALKSKTLGQLLGKEAISRKSYDISFGDSKNPRFEFRFNIVVLQYYLHETGQAKGSPEAWNTIAAGKKAFLQTWHSMIRKSDFSQIIADCLIKR